MRRRVNQEICLMQDDKVSRTEGCEILERVSRFTDTVQGQGGTHERGHV